MLDDFLIRATLAGLGTAIAAGGLGCFVVWRRMAYFGDATAHAAILGVALALVTDLPVEIGVLAIALAMVLLLHRLTGRTRSADTVLGVLAHSALALGLLSVSLIPGLRVDLDAYLFGDVLTVSRTDLAVIWGGALLTSGVLIWRWRPLLTATLHPDLAVASGIAPRREELVLTLALAAVVAVALKVVGALLITALLIIPASSARVLARSPEGMAVLACAIGALASLGGVGAAMVADTPVGPSIVAIAALIFVLSLGVGWVAARGRSRSSPARH